jgi:hypothetical protein
LIHFYKRCVSGLSTSYFDQVPNIRQVRSHYINDPVKYDLTKVPKSF